MALPQLSLLHIVGKAGDGVRADRGTSPCLYRGAQIRVLAGSALMKKIARSETESSGLHSVNVLQPEWHIVSHFKGV